MCKVAEASFSEQRKVQSNSSKKKVIRRDQGSRRFSGAVRSGRDEEEEKRKQDMIAQRSAQIELRRQKLNMVSSCKRFSTSIMCSKINKYTLYLS